MKQACFDNIILCGSNSAYSKNTGKFIDNFSHIVRHNMLLPSALNGQKKSHLQIVNCHVWRNLHNLDKEAFIANYKYLDLPLEVVSGLYELFNDKREIFATFVNNNTTEMKNLLSSIGSDLNLNREIRCGLALIPILAAENIRPILFGYTIQNQDIFNHAYDRNPSCENHGIQIGHNCDEEIKCIIDLHNAELIDASLCCLHISPENWPIKITNQGLTLFNLYNEYN